MALALDSKLFAAGVDIHGVHDFVAVRWIAFSNQSEKYEKTPDMSQALEIAWESSPVGYVDTWTSPVMIIHGDDDRNVRFNQSTDLVRRLQKKGVEMETMVIVDDTHHFMKHANQLTVDRLIADYLVKKLMKNK